MRSLLLKFSILTAMLLGLPLLGIVLAGYTITRYLEFPPETRYIYHAPFSWFVFIVYTIFIIAFIFPLIIKSILWSRQIKIISYTSSVFPWWGWMGVITGAVSWILAWTRFPWFARFQPHTFTPLWFSFILVINALCHRRTGHCMMVDRTRFFLLLLMHKIPKFIT